MKLPKLREIKEAIRAILKGPYTSKFPLEEHKPYLSFRGQPKFNPDKCVGCLACEAVCPVSAIDHIDIVEEKASPPRRLLLHYTDTCIFCGQCESACIADHQGIKLSNDWELSFFNRKEEAYESIEKELQIGEICGQVLACKDHLEWISTRLGELIYSNPTLYLSRLKGLGIIEKSLISAVRDYNRSDRVKILCSRCRRETTRNRDR